MKPSPLDVFLCGPPLLQYRNPILCHRTVKWGCLGMSVLLVDFCACLLAWDHAVNTHKPFFHLFTKYFLSYLCTFHLVWMITILRKVWGPAGQSPPPFLTVFIKTHLLISPISLQTEQKIPFFFLFFLTWIVSCYLFLQIFIFPIYYSHCNFF